MGLLQLSYLPSGLPVSEPTPLTASLSDFIAQGYELGAPLHAQLRKQGILTEPARLTGAALVVCPGLWVISDAGPTYYH